MSGVQIPLSPPDNSQMVGSLDASLKTLNHVMDSLEEGVQPVSNWAGGAP